MEPVYTWEEDIRPAKRQKTMKLGDALHQASMGLESGPQEDVSDVANSGVAAANPSTAQLPIELCYMQDKFDFTTMSIVSSSKMEQKVRNLLLRTKRPSKETKPGVVILTAKADVASKMVGIVEIAKRTIRQEGGKWWQYSKLHSQVIELKKKSKAKRAEGGKTLREWAEEQKEKGENVSGGMRENHIGGHDMPDDKGASLDDSEKDENDDDAFQTMGRHQVMAYDENRSKMRAIPIMTIYLSQAPVPALRTTCR